MSDKEIKKTFKRKAQKNPEKHYPVKALKAAGFERQRCGLCKQFFWNVGKQKTCGDSSCAGGFHFIGNSPARKKLDYIETWKAFAKVHKKLGYTAIDRYPVVARWNPTTDFTIASIAAFQPFVVSGEVKPPANPLVIPQFCLRFNDIDNVGITGAHYVGFVMMGQHAFVAPRKYNVDQYFNDHLTWLNKGMGLDVKDISISEDAWAGGGNLGPSVEFFSAGLEISNQVYMQYESSAGSVRDLGIKVLDMGQGHERVPWFTHGESTSYETSFPTVVKELRRITGVKIDKKLMKKFLPYAAWLNIDEVADIDKAWKKVAGKVDIPVKELKKHIQEQAALYSIAEHSRALLFAVSDGALPSNVGGGYNLRVIYRRAQGFIRRFGWDIYLPELCKLHAQYLKSLFPELKKNLADVKKILDVESNKYDTTRQKAHAHIKNVVRKKIDDRILLQLYDSQGISPELVKEEAAKLNVNIDIPENFYARVALLHEKKKQVHETKNIEKLPLDDCTETHALYFDDWKAPENFTAHVLKIIGKHVVLDKTWFYPTSGGQLHDIGSLAGVDVVDVFKQGARIVHVLKKAPGFSVGDDVVGTIAGERRKQLAQHHTATHIINAASRTVLGNHINQASARKTLEKGSIDITHFARLNDAELLEIEKEANKIVNRNAVIHKSFIPREEAEKKHGVRIYQGGVAPGKKLRIVDIKGVDVEACGGTHLNKTGEAELIHIIHSNKIADDVVRIEYVAGDAARTWEKAVEERGGAVKKLVQKELGVDVSVRAHSMQLAAEVFAISVEQLYATFAKFIRLIKKNDKTLKSLGKHTAKKFSKDSVHHVAVDLFRYWKEQQKKIEKMHVDVVSEKTKRMKEKSVLLVETNGHALRDMAMKFKQVLLMNKEGTFVFRGSDAKFKELVFLGAKGGGKDLRQGRVDDVKKVLNEFKF
jgi:alanyl-tRNA synthetase